MTDGPRVLALDIATKTGWAVDHPVDPGRPQFGTIVLPRPAFEGDYGTRLSIFRGALVRMVAEHRPTHLTYEAPRPNTGEGDTNIHTIMVLIMLAGIAEEVGTTLKLDVRAANIASVRKHFIGTSRGRRDEMKRAVMGRCKQLGWNPLDDNSADACAIWDFQRHILRANARLEPAMPMFAPKRG